MLFLYGLSTRKKTKKHGKFDCPQCASRQRFKLQELRRVFHIFFVPLFKVKTLGRQVECAKCRSAFDENVLAKG